MNIIGNMRQLKYFVFFLVVLLAGCNSKPATVAPAEARPVPVQEPASPPVEEAPAEVFDPQNISREVFDNTKNEVQQFIEQLNGIILGKNYNEWKAHLSDAYFGEISSADFLRRASEMPAMKMQKIVLKTPQDYFNRVVVPSRANSRVDDIEFTGEKSVKAYTFNARNERLRLYELEQTGGTWKIIN